MKLRPRVGEHENEPTSLVAEALRRSGHRVVDAGCEAAVVELLGTASGDLIVTDARVHGWEGVAVLQASEQHDAAMPCVFISVDELSRLDLDAISLSTWPSPVQPMADMIVPHTPFASTSDERPLTTVPAHDSSYPLDEILDGGRAEKLAKVGVTTSHELLEKAACRRALRALARESKLAIGELSRVVRMCDLLRVPGVAPDTVQLLKATRVTTVRQLGGQDPSKLHQAMAAANNEGAITESTPTVKQVAQWIAHARKLVLR
jgi:hypothetical protein